MSLPVGARLADPELPDLPERPFADASAPVSGNSPVVPDRRSRWKRVEALLWAIAASSALLILLVAADRAVFNYRQNRVFDDSRVLRERASEPVTAELAQAAAGGRAAGKVVRSPLLPFVAKLDIPTIALTALVVDGVDAQTLRRAVGRIPSSSLPGEPGDVALAGHRDTDFRALGALALGDALILRTADGEYQYEVESIRIVTPQRVDVLTPADHPTLTLVTCYPFHFVGPAPQRYIVRAREVARPSRATI